MRRYLLDTGIAGQYINFRNPVYARARAEVACGNVIGTSTPVLGELRHGAENSNDPAGNLGLLRLARREWKVWALDEAAAAEYGRLRAQMDRIGRRIGAIDLQTAAIARTLGNCTVVTMDGDFSRVPGLDIEDWSV